MVAGAGVFLPTGESDFVSSFRETAHRWESLGTVRPRDTPRPEFYDGPDLSGSARCVGTIRSRAIRADPGRRKAPPAAWKTVEVDWEGDSTHQEAQTGPRVDSIPSPSLSSGVAVLTVRTIPRLGRD